MEHTPDEGISIDHEVINNDFVKEKSSQPLRVCCYGSSSSKTPERYLKEARTLGYMLAKRGHICVNGAGSFGCMAAMNDGCSLGNGHIIGVIHEVFLVDSQAGAHAVFGEEKSGSKRDGPIREILVARGNDLQERKRLLVDKANALVVLPGGPGTWDELWEMACARQIGLSKLPIVCINIDGFYEPFRVMLERASQDNLLHLDASQIVHFEDTVEGAVRWIEKASVADSLNISLKRRSSALRRSSFLHNPILGKSDSWLTESIGRSVSFVTDYLPGSMDSFSSIVSSSWFQRSFILTVGFSVGYMVATSSREHSRKAI